MRPWGSGFDDENLPGIQDQTLEYEVVRTMYSQEAGRCCLNEEHRIRRGDKIGKLQHADNPFIPVSGWACKHCTSIYPKAR